MSSEGERWPSRGQEWWALLMRARGVTSAGWQEAHTRVCVTIAALHAAYGERVSTLACN